MKKVWLTRPAGQADALKEALDEQGNLVSHIPLLVIEPLPWDAKIKSKILDFDHFDVAIFISRNAAKLAMECINNYWPQYPVHLKNVALGPTSAKVLEDFDLEVIYPREIMTSEAVLALPEMASVVKPDSKVIIFRGVGGRETLAEGLRKTGASVEYVELYKRTVPLYSRLDIESYLEAGEPDAVVISSAETLSSFVQLFTGLFPSLFDVTIFVSSSRIKELALEQGFTNIVEMAAANDDAILTSLNKHFANKL